jgi:hypothetical protein
MLSPWRRKIKNKKGTSGDLNKAEMAAAMAEWDSKLHAEEGVLLEAIYQAALAHAEEGVLLEAIYQAALARKRAVRALARQAPNGADDGDEDGDQGAADDDQGDEGGGPGSDQGGAAARGAAGDQDNGDQGNDAGGDKDGDAGGAAAPALRKDGGPWRELASGAVEAARRRSPPRTNAASGRAAGPSARAPVGGRAAPVKFERSALPGSLGARGRLRYIRLARRPAAPPPLTGSRLQRPATAAAARGLARP